MKNFLTHVNLILLSVTMLLSGPAQAQFETIFGDLDGPEEMADIKSLANEHTVVLANTTTYGPQKIAMAELSAIGEVEWFRIIEDAINTDIELTGRSLELAYNQEGNHVGYYITGCRNEYYPQLIVIRTDLEGTPVWTRTMYNTDRRDTLEECGISLEIQVGGDIMVVGTSTNISTGNNRFVVARLNADGVLLWCNRYGSVQGAQFYPIESCNGLRGYVPVIAIVGHVHQDGYGHTFVSCIRAGTGVEIWRREYHNFGYHDTGNDIVQNPLNQRFMVVGQIDSLDGRFAMWVFNANVLNGTLIDGSAYSQPSGNLVATDVCLATPSNSVILVGRRDSIFLGPFTFAMRLPFTAGAAPVWGYNYGDSSPDILSDEDVDRYTASLPGYYFVGSKGNGNDLYVAKIGTGGDQLCSGVPFTTVITPAGHSESINKHKTPADEWIQNTLMASDQEIFQSICWPSGVEFELSEIEDLTVELLASAYPNPIFKGDLLSIEVVLSEPSEIGIQLVDAYNRIHVAINEFREDGTQTFMIKMPEAAYSNIYYVRISLPNGQQKMLKIVANL